ncbi:beta-lactamase/transpeptidase-like protein [Mytilinidion resinicola]|uniref:Beta-lactamase/transpeptidase-like protein n=1 Tax=Mytilinidion resinicola TaxID=574789 RepID=A0A6A6XZL1_9PEZI|nr:beta-lactamase/transpeptidase-like protein [Mytilinidion resinicola]KAF2801728.1 beta-lactamase/transpeptidase-like protein [Mytilinidion resinicola]
MKDIVKALQELGPTISKICEVSANAGVSVGVLHHNEVIYPSGYGYRDISRKLRSDENTVYHLASLSKSFTASAVGILLHENKLVWDQPLSKILPSFIHENTTIQSDATILDFPSHQILLKPEDLFPTTSYLEVVHLLRSTWLYNNWGFNLAAAVLEHLSGTTWGSFLADNLFRPLGLNRTYTKEVILDDNVAQGYMAARDGSSFPGGNPTIAEGIIMEGANGVKSTVADLLTYYKSVIKSWKEELSSGSSETDGLPFKDIRTLLTGHISLDPESDCEEFYGAGWAITQLPFPVGSIGINGMFVEAMPVVGKGTAKRLLRYHNGSLVGFFSSIHILPDTDTAIVVLCNSLAKNDAADWIGQLLLESILDTPEKNDYLDLATKSAAAYDAMWDQVPVDLEKSKSSKTNGRPLSEYTGKFYNKVRKFFIEVEEVEGKLQFRFQGLSSQVHHLQYHNIDTFSWPLTEVESLHLGRWPDLDATMYIFYFQSSEDGKINGLRWEHDGDVPDGEVFLLRPVVQMVDQTSMKPLPGIIADQNRDEL